MSIPRHNRNEHAAHAFGGRSGKASATVSRFGRNLGRWLSEYRWYLTGLMWVVALILGYVGFSEYFSRVGEVRTHWDILYRTFQLFALESEALQEPINWPLQIARFLAPILTVYTAAQALAFVLRDQFQRMRLGLARDHVIICGLGRKGLLLAEGFRDSGNSVVVIEKDDHNDRFERCLEIGAVTIVGDATRPETLRKSRVGRAKYIISVCGHDGTNAEVAILAQQLSRHRKGAPLRCLVHIVDSRLCALLCDQAMHIGRHGNFRLEFFNVFESGARILLSEYMRFDQLLDSAERKPRIVVVGMGYMGESIVVNAARRWRDIRHEPHDRLIVSMVDRAALSKRDYLSSYYPGLDSLCEVTADQMETESREFEDAGFLFDKDGKLSAEAVFVCLDDDSRALATALELAQRVRGFPVPIVVRMSSDTGLATLLQSGDGEQGARANLRPFLVLEQTCTPDLIFGCSLEILARAFHEQYVATERSKGSTIQEKPYMVPWEQLGEQIKESNRNEAQHVPVKLEAIGCDLAMTSDLSPEVFQFTNEEVEMMAEMEHERWRGEKREGKWKWGPERDEKKKTHPNMVEWKRLTEKDRDIDRDAVRSIPALLARAGFVIYRVR